MPTDLLDLLALTLVPGVGPGRLAALLERFGDAGTARRAGRAALVDVPGLGPKVAGAIVEAAGDLSAAEAEFAEIERAGAAVLVRGRPGYPVWLAAIPRAPVLLMVRGSLTDEDERSVAIVGSRQCSAYGLDQAARFSRAMAEAGVTVVSGGARGIDAAAHRAALRSGGRTVAVLGCGLSLCYPPEHEGLYEEIALGGRGAVVSELPMRTPPSAENFPARNRIISGLSRGTLVVEAGRKSGALITARLAAEDHGREVMALPGRVTDAASLGSLDLIRAGAAALVTEPADVLFQIRAVGTARDARRVSREDEAGAAASPEPVHEVPGLRGAPIPVLPAPESLRGRILAALTSAMTGEELLAKLPEVDPGSMRREVTMLELTGLVRRSGGKLVPRCPETDTLAQC